MTVLLPENSVMGYAAPPAEPEPQYQPQPRAVTLIDKLYDAIMNPVPPEELERRRAAMARVPIEPPASGIAASRANPAPSFIPVSGQKAPWGTAGHERAISRDRDEQRFERSDQDYKMQKPITPNMEQADPPQRQTGNSDRWPKPTSEMTPEELDYELGWGRHADEAIGGGRRS